MKRILVVILAIFLITGCSGEKEVKDLSEVILNMDNMITQMENYFQGIDKVVEADLEVDRQIEVGYDDASTIQDLVTYFESNKSYITENIEKSFTEYKKQADIYDYLVDYERMVLQADLNKLKEELHQKVLEKDQEYENVKTTLKTISNNVINYQKQQDTLFLEIKEISSEISHTLHNATEEENLAINDINTKVNVALIDLNKFYETNGKLSALVDEKRNLVSTHDYNGLVEKYQALETIMKERIDLLTKLKEDLETLKQML